MGNHKYTAFIPVYHFVRTISELNIHGNVASLQLNCSGTC